MPHSNLSKQRILILGVTIFEEGVARLLTIGTDLQVSCVKYTDDLALLDNIEQNRPDVILLNESTPLNLAHIFKLLLSIPSLVGLRVIIMRLSDNLIDVYAIPAQIVARSACQRQQFNVTERDELVAVVRG